jgi:4a-hydroxytetrahydrobiopterin dehydratase
VRVKADELASRNCVPCRGGIPPLSEEKARALLAGTPLWSLEEQGARLARRFEFRDFVQAMEFVNRVAEIAEAQGHHPDIAIHWNKVDLVVWTHAIGGLHENDFILAAKIDRLLDPPKGSAEPAG